ncbi:hypothetical protein F4860DRAFT_171826 [Xylaria cubensis]|nr:hypothetical protein F4860DRAFT_171826 [Xylaria cubensis]
MLVKRDNGLWRFLFTFPIPPLFLTIYLSIIQPNILHRSNTHTHTHTHTHTLTIGYVPIGRRRSATGQDDTIRYVCWNGETDTEEEKGKGKDVGAGVFFSSSLTNHDHENTQQIECNEITRTNPLNGKNESTVFVWGLLSRGKLAFSILSSRMKRNKKDNKKKKKKKKRTTDICDLHCIL